MPELDYRKVTSYQSLMSQISTGITKAYIKQDYVRYDRLVCKRLKTTKEVLDHCWIILSDCQDKFTALVQLRYEMDKQEYAIKEVSHLLRYFTIEQQKEVFWKVEELRLKNRIYTAIYHQVRRLEQ